MKPARPTIPLSSAEITSGWLTQALQRAGRLANGEAVDLIDIRPLAAGTAYTTQMFRVRLSGPRLPASAILKLSVSGPVRQVLDGVGAYAREVAFYRDVAAGLPVRIPGAYIAEIDQQSGDMVLMIEDLAPLSAVDQLAGLSLQQAEAAVDGLARFHAWSWNHPRLAQYASRFPAIDAPAGRALLERYASFFAMSWPAASQASADVSEAVRAFGDRFTSLIPFFIDKLAAPATIVHGELRSDNLFFDADGRLILIDFQSVVQAAGVYDVSYLLSQSMTIAARRGHDQSLMRRYWEGLVSAGVTGYSWELAWEQYRLGVAYNLIFPGMAFMAYEAADPRGKALLLQMLSRASAAIADNDALALIPKHSG
jgi:hypothetical protein